MFNIDRRKYNKIMLTRGDSASILVEVYDLDGKQYEIQADDVITMSVKKPGSDFIAIEKTATPEHYIIFNPEDTAYLSVGLYQYDVQLEMANGNVYTIVPPAIFDLTDEVTQARRPM